MRVVRSLSASSAALAASVLACACSHDPGGGPAPATYGGGGGTQQCEAPIGGNTRAWVATGQQLQSPSGQGAGVYVEYAAGGQRIGRQRDSAGASQRRKQLAG